MWNRLSKRQQAAARLARDKLHAAGWGCAVSRMANHMDLTMDYLRGTVPAVELARAIRAERLTREVNASEAAKHLGVSVRTVQRRAQRGLITARKDSRGRWIVTL